MEKREACQVVNFAKFRVLVTNGRTIANFARFSPLLQPNFFWTMAKAKKTRKFAATKRLINVKRDTRLKSVKEKLEKKQEKKEHELVREV